MKTMAKEVLFSIAMLGFASMAFAVYPDPTKYPAPENPGTGIWIQQVGEIFPHTNTSATLYYTKYSNEDRVKSVDYKYDGAGYLQLLNKKTLCTQSEGVKGADGIVQHWDGNLVVAGQQNSVVYKVRRETDKDHGEKCLIASGSTKAEGRAEEIYHLMNDPTGNYVWAAGIPGKLFRIAITNSVPGVTENYDTTPYYVPLTTVDKPSGTTSDALSTLIWDEAGNMFFTYSDYFGGGCEKVVGGTSFHSKYDFGHCSTEDSIRKAASAYFGYISSVTKVHIDNADLSKKYRAPIGTDAIIGMEKTPLITSLVGAHGGVYDKYSKTIFVFGNSRIVQIEPYREDGKMKARVVAVIDLKEYFFDEDYEHFPPPRTDDQVGFRLDQGTVDNLGHLFVASNTGHLIFVDYAANPNKRIDDNVLVHMQWIDNFLDDLAPLSGVNVGRKKAGSGTDTQMSSGHTGISMTVFSSSSATRKSSSSRRVSSGNLEYSSYEIPTTSTGGKSSVGDDPNTSGSTGNSSNGGGKSSAGDNPNTSGSTGNSSNGGDNPNTSGSTGNSSNGGSRPNTSGSTNKSCAGDDGQSSSSQRRGYFDDDDINSSSSRRYAGFEDFDISSDGGINFYPSKEKYDDGDKAVSESKVLIPGDPDDPDAIKVGENWFKYSDDVEGLDINLSDNAKMDTAWVGSVISITLGQAELKEIFGENVDSLTFATNCGLMLVDPNNPGMNDTITVKPNGDVALWVTADAEVTGGYIVVTDNRGNVILIDNINFFDPIPEADKGYIKDSNGDTKLDYVEIVLKDTLPAGYSVKSVSIVVGKDTLPAGMIPDVESAMIPQLYDNPKKVDVVTLDVSDISPDFPEKFPADAKALITYVDKDGSQYLRSSDLFEMGSQIIKNAYAIRDVNGMDSLFVEFNVDLIPADISTPELVVALKEKTQHLFKGGGISNVYMPTKNLVIFVGENMGLQGDMKDSVMLYPGVTFENVPYITFDEYDRTVPVTVVDRMPSVVNVEYWDTDDDGVLDQIVTKFNSKITSDDIEKLHMTYPWYSDRGLLIQLGAEPNDFVMTSDSMGVIWLVSSPTPLASGVTSISQSLPEAIVYNYYPILGRTFITEENAPLVDKMAPVISAASLNYGSKSDTLSIIFSEAVQYKDLSGMDFFSCIHGKDTLDLVPSKINWSSDGRVAQLILDGNKMTVMPGDSLMVVKGRKSNIHDNFGNVAGENPQAVVITGLLNHLVEATNMGSFDANDDRVVYSDDDRSYTLQTVSSVNLRYVPSSVTKKDLEKEGSLGQLVQLGERFVPQLLDRAQISSDGSIDPSVLDSLSPDKVFITFVINYYDHLGQYVNDTTITVPCNSPKFGGNCLNTDQKVFVNWNFKDHTGRFVGSGVYSVQFKMVVRYDKKKIEEEIKDKWGVRRKRGKRN